jgi:hypothetical protein
MWRVAVARFESQIEMAVVELRINFASEPNNGDCRAANFDLRYGGYTKNTNP